nr:unnamed protein product [Leishmania braziliensis]
MAGHDPSNHISAPRRSSPAPLSRTRFSAATLEREKVCKDEPEAIVKDLSLNSLTSPGSPSSSFRGFTALLPLASTPVSPPYCTAPPLSMPRLRLLSFTTELGIGASVYNSIYPRLCTIEYLLSVAMVIYLCAYAFCTLRVFCAKNIHHYLRDLLAPNTFLRRYNAIGYDKHVDSQWGRFTQQYTTLVELSAFMGATTFLCRCVSSTSMSRAPSTADSISSYDISQNGLAGTTNGAVTNIGTRGGRLPAESSASDVRASKLVSLALRVWRIIAGHSWSIPAFYTVTGFIFVAAVHGPHFFLPLLLIIANYVIFLRLQRLCPYWLFMATMWATHVAGLYIIEIANGFEGTYWLQYFFTTSADEALNLLGYEQKPLWDTNMRWAISFRMSTLRLISFNYDLWEATHAAARARERATAKHDATCIECAQLREQNAALAAALPAEASRCYKYRTEYPRDPADYNFVNYAAYTLFPPLYLGGPMSSFNAFVSYMRVPSTSMPLRKMVTYAFAIFRIYATTVLLLHFVHLPALAKHSYLITEMSFQEQTHYFYYTLAYLWLKFNFIWKSSRLFAMLSGIEVPEDMRRCFNASYTVREFWRDWHASFNLWVVRYMYIPMGGSSRVALSVLPIFLFIALWHDPVLHLVKWALCIAVMFMAEVAVSGCFGWAVAAFRREMAAVAPTGAVNDATLERESPITDPVRRRLLARLARLCARRLSPSLRAWSYRMLRVLGGIIAFAGLLLVNLVGFSMQNEQGTGEKMGWTDKPVNADSAILRTLRQLTSSFLLGLLLYLYCSISITVTGRDIEASERQALKERYGLV